MIMSFVLIFVTKENPFLSQKKKIHFGGIYSTLEWQYGWFVGILHLPLAEVFALEFTVPVWASILAYFILKEQLGWQQGSWYNLGYDRCAVCGSARDRNYPARLAGGVGCSSMFCDDSCVDAFFGGRRAQRWWFLYVPDSVTYRGLLSASVWQWPDPIQAVWLIWIGLSALAAHFSMTRALHYSSVQTVLTLDFIRLPFIALVGVVLYSELLDYWIIVGVG